MLASVAAQINDEVGGMNLLQIKTLEELVEEVRRCACTGRCSKCRSALDRMDGIIEREYRDVVREGLQKPSRKGGS